MIWPFTGSCNPGYGWFDPSHGAATLTGGDFKLHMVKMLQLFLDTCSHFQTHWYVYFAQWSSHVLSQHYNTQITPPLTNAQGDFYIVFVVPMFPALTLTRGDLTLHRELSPWLGANWPFIMLRTHQAFMSCNTITMFRLFFPLTGTLRFLFHFDVVILVPLFPAVEVNSGDLTLHREL